MTERADGYACGYYYGLWGITLVIPEGCSEDEEAGRREGYADGSKEKQRLDDERNLPVDWSVFDAEYDDEEDE